MMDTQVTFDAIGTTCRVLVTDPRHLEAAERITRAHLANLDEAVSRFRDDSELMRITRAARFGAVRAEVSPIFAECLRAALRTAALTEGLVTPTVGAALIANGYDADIEIVRARTTLASPTRATAPGMTTEPGMPPAPGMTTAPARETRVPSYEQVELDGTTLRLPKGIELDFGASAKAWAADMIARDLGERLIFGGVLVNLGGDLAVGGELPPGGWNIGIEDHQHDVDQWVRSTGQAFATSSTQLRRWGGTAAARHHIIDPRTGESADVVWSKVTCAAANAVEANAASTASIILGHEAPNWLCDNAIAARLDGLHGEIFYTPGFPVDQEMAAA